MTASASAVQLHGCVVVLYMGSDLRCLLRQARQPAEVFLRKESFRQGHRFGPDTDLVIVTRPSMASVIPSGHGLKAGPPRAPLE